MCICFCRSKHTEYVTFTNNVCENNTSLEKDYSFNFNTLLLMCNVCGLKENITTPDILNTINKYASIGYQETKLDDTDFIQLNNLKKIIMRKSGGLADVIHKNITKYVTYF